MKDEQYDSNYFVRVAVESGGCSGLSYKLNFDNEEKKGDQFFEDKGVKICLDIKSFLYLAGTELDYSDGLDGKGLPVMHRWPKRSVKLRLPRNIVPSPRKWCQNGWKWPMLETIMR